MDMDFFANNDRKRVQPRGTQTTVPEEKKAEPKATSEENYYEGRSYKKTREYPERTFDKYAKKLIQVRDEDLSLLEELSSTIASQKRRLPAHLRNPKRVTSNAIIRKVLQVFCESMEDTLNNTDFSKIQTETDVEFYVKKVLKS